VVAHMCNRVAVMCEGKLLECLSVEDLRHNRCTDPYTKQLLKASMVEPIEACPACPDQGVENSPARDDLQ
jgi:ABC-type dipeptide/oligopeptide/nickel transport system ATPase component